VIQTDASFAVFLHVVASTTVASGIGEECRQRDDDAQSVIPQQVVHPPSQRPIVNCKRLM
jgi:hypothetical protein